MIRELVTERVEQFERIIETKGVNKWKGITARMIRDKWNLLYSFKPESVENLTDLPKGQKGEFNRVITRF